MKTLLQVLSEEERSRVHECTLDILANTGVRVDTALGREYLLAAGAEVDSNTKIVRFPRDLVEESLRLAPKEFTLGARRPGWDLKMNTGDCVLMPDGEATTAKIDWESGERQSITFKDWLDATRLIDAIDEIGVYWTLAEGGEGNSSHPDMVKYWRNLFANFSKHVQEGISHKDQAPWFLEVLQVIFGDKDTIRFQNPLSFLLCPLSPLAIDEQYTDAYLALAGWDIPVAIMPMPLMGGTAPGTLISTIILGNCEVLAMLCLVQAAAPGTPIIYAPVWAVMNPRTGLYSSGAIENGLLGAAAVEMARHYGLPAEGTGGGTDHFVPGIQAGYERALNAILPILSWPDLLVGPGLLGGSTFLSLEQLVIDVEVFRMSKQAHRGIVTSKGKWLDEVIAQVGPSGHFLNQPSTRQALRDGEWYISEIGMHGTYEAWQRSGKPRLLEEAHEKVEHLLANHQPLPFDADAERELDLIQKRAFEAMNA